MKQYKKTRQRRKTYRKTGQRKTKSTGNSQPSSVSATKRVKWAFVAAVIVFAATVGFFSLRFLLRTDQKPQQTKHPSNQAQEQVLLPVREPPRTEQEFAALKNQEYELAENLMRDFPDNQNSLMIMGNIFHRQGNAIEALKFYNRVLKINPKRADVYAVMGQLSLDEGKLAEAVGHWRKALDIQPRLPNAHSNIGHALMMLGRGDEAIEAFEKEIRISPNSSLAYFLLGQTYLMQEEHGKARENYELAIKINPGYTNAYYGLATVCAKLGNSDKAKEYTEKFQKLKADERKDLTGRKARYDDTDQTLKNTALTYIEAAQMYRGAGKLDKAEELLKQAAGLDPENVACLLELASLYEKNGRLSKALQMYKKIREIEPGNALCHFSIGILSTQLNKFDDAEKAFGKVITLEPQRSNGYRELALLYIKTGQKIPQAMQLAEKAVALEATALNYFALGWACYKNGDNAKALPAMKRAVELEPGNPEYRRFYDLIRQRNLRK
ncbi:MAG: tetratricopeptide repeat protein [Planctomycetes bacterium]|nr:tetratricopeptide repeat protein [Planctomycetota bacterium]